MAPRHPSYRAIFFDAAGTLFHLSKSAGYHYALVGHRVGLPLEAAMQSMRGDKKAEAGAIRFILLERIGRAIQRTVPEGALRDTLAAGGYV